MTEKKVINFNQPADFFYRSAQKMMDNGSYISALSTIRRAVEMDPVNSEFSLCLAEVLTELTKYEESNRVLFEMIERYEEVDADCFFCLGCNFMGLNDAEKARESFEKYLQIDPDGEYSEDVEDFLYYFDMEADDIREFMEDEEADDPYNKAAEGKKHLDNAEYEKAVEILESIDDRDDGLSYAKNNLALAYYCLQNTEKAIEVTKKVLRGNKMNVHANCNMAIFVNETEGPEAAGEYVYRALSAKNIANEDLYKISITLCELKMHEEAVKYLKELADSSPYDEKVLFYLAAALHNTKRFKEAIMILDDIKKLDHPGVIAEYYIKKINNELAHPEEFEEMDYIYQVPSDEAKRKIKYLNDCLKLPDEEFARLWKEEKEFFNTALWGLEYGDENIKRAIAGMIAGFADEKAEKVLRAFILSKNQSDEVKNDIFLLLKRMNAKEPYVAYIKDEVVEVKVGTYDENGKDITAEYTKLFRLLYEIIDRDYPEEVLKSVLEVVQAYIEAETGAPAPEVVNEIGAAILYIALEDCGLAEPIRDICDKMGAEEQLTKDYICIIRRPGDNDECQK